MRLATSAANEWRRAISIMRKGFATSLTGGCDRGISAPARRGSSFSRSCFKEEPPGFERLLQY